MVWPSKHWINWTSSRFWTAPGKSAGFLSLLKPKDIFFSVISFHYTLTLSKICRYYGQTTHRISVLVKVFVYGGPQSNINKSKTILNQSKYLRFHSSHRAQTIQMTTYKNSGVNVDWKKIRQNKRKWVREIPRSAFEPHRCNTRKRSVFIYKFHIHIYFTAVN